MISPVALETVTRMSASPPTLELEASLGRPRLKLTLPPIVNPGPHIDSEEEKEEEEEEEQKEGELVSY